MGPSQTLSSWAASGILYPNPGLPAYSIDEGMSTMPYGYAKLDVDPTKPVRTFPSLPAAVESQGQTGEIPPGETRFVAYTTKMDVNNNHYVELAETGEWVRASPYGYSTFRGLFFLRNPQTDFGWVVNPGKSRSGPATTYPETGNLYNRNTIVQVYAIVDAQGIDWYQIGANEWLSRDLIRIVDVNLTPPEGVSNNRWIEVNLYEQTLSVYAEGRLQYAALIATGVPSFPTRPGLFQIREKKDYETMTGSFTADRSDYYYFERVPWTMYFDGARALHAAYWRTNFGYEASHGCVNLSPADAHWLFDWAAVGDYVYVWDPSGKTPTDPAFYTEGGA